MGSDAETNRRERMVVRFDDAEPVRGVVEHPRGVDAFAGWLELLAVLEEALVPRPGTHC